MIWGGIGLAAVGFAYGIPSAIVYHWMLYRSLLAPTAYQADGGSHPLPYTTSSRATNARECSHGGRSEGPAS